MPGLDEVAGEVDTDEAGPAEDEDVFLGNRGGGGDDGGRGGDGGDREAARGDGPAGKGGEGRGGGALGL